MTAAPDLSAALAELAAAPSPARKEFRELLRSAPRALYRDGGPHHLTASAVVIDAPAEHVALIWHRKGRFWVQPGGHLEEGESSFERAARREVAEEIGLSDLQRVGPGPAVLHRHALDAAFGRCTEHWDVQYLLRARESAAQLPLTASMESPEVVWVPWPLIDGGPRRSSSALPPGTVADMPGKLAELAEHLADVSPT